MLLKTNCLNATFSALGTMQDSTAPASQSNRSSFISAVGIATVHATIFILNGSTRRTPCSSFGYTFVRTKSRNIIWQTTYLEIGILFWLQVFVNKVEIKKQSFDRDLGRRLESNLWQVCLANVTQIRIARSTNSLVVIATGCNLHTLVWQ